MAESYLTPALPHHRPALPAEVTLTREDMSGARFTPRELRMIKEQFGRSYVEVMADDSSDDKFVVMAWTKLRRDGHDVTVEEMDDVVIEVPRRRGDVAGPYERNALDNLAAFCRYWRMTPRQVSELTHDEYLAFWRFAEKQARDQERAARAARRGR